MSKTIIILQVQNRRHLKAWKEAILSFIVVQYVCSKFIF